MQEPGRLIVWISLFLGTSVGCVTYTVPTAKGPALGVPRQMFGVGPGNVDVDSFRRNGWAPAENGGSTQSYIHARSGDGDVSELEAIVTTEPRGSRIDLVRLRYATGRLATYRELLRALIEKHGPPQDSREVVSYSLLALDPRSDRPRPSRVIVHRWEGGSVDLVLAAGLEDAANLETAMDYQVLLVSPSTSMRTVDAP